MHGYFGCNAAAEPHTLPFWELHRQVHHILKKKKKIFFERAWHC